MVWVDLITFLSLLQYLVFGALVSKARNQYGVKAPAVTGHPSFERLYRVQMNTLETLVVFLPALYLAARYWSPLLVAALGLVYLVGRVVYLRAYVSNPAGRALGYTLSLAPVVLLLLAVAIGLLRTLV